MDAPQRPSKGVTLPPRHDFSFVESANRNHCLSCEKPSTAGILPDPQATHEASPIRSAFPYSPPPFCCPFSVPLVGHYLAAAAPVRPRRLARYASGAGSVWAHLRSVMFYPSLRRRRAEGGCCEGRAVSARPVSGPQQPVHSCPDLGVAICFSVWVLVLELCLGHSWGIGHCAPQVPGGPRSPGEEG